MITYRYAKNQQGEIVDIADVKEHDKFFCLGCGEKVQAYLSPNSNRAKHFRHGNSTCSQETYLHQLGKYHFIRLYNLHKATGTPFRIAAKHQCTCEYDICPHGKKSVCEGSIDEFFDISAYNYCAEEEWDENLRPDVKLWDDAGNKLYIEVKVNHSCTEEKISRGIPIIEIALENDKDLDVFSDNAFLTKNNPKFTFYHLWKAPVLIPPKCQQDVAKAKQIFGRQHQKLKREGKEMNFPCQKAYICPKETCPYLLNPTCMRFEDTAYFDAVKQFPRLNYDSSSVSSLYLGNNSGSAKLLIDLVFDFKDESSYTPDEHVVQVRMTEDGHYLLGDVKPVNLKKELQKSVCDCRKYVLIAVFDDESVRWLGEAPLPQLYANYLQHRTRIKDYIILDMENLLDPGQMAWEKTFCREEKTCMNHRVYKFAVAYFINLGLPVKSCFMCLNSHVNQYWQDNPNSPLWCPANKRCYSTEAVTKRCFVPNEGWAERMKVPFWMEALDKAYNERRFK